MSQMHGRRFTVEPEGEHYIGIVVCQKVAQVLKVSAKQDCGEVVVSATDFGDRYQGRELLSNSKSMSMMSFTKRAAEK